jgi:hypothetical protein
LDNKEQDKFEEYLTKWKSEFSCVDLPVYVIAKIWTRFYYTLGRQTEEKEIKYLGQGMHHFIVAFLHSILVEESIYWNQSNINLSNPTTDDSLFINKISKYGESCKFFKMFFACPIWGLYLKPNSDLWNKYWENIEKSQDKAQKEELKNCFKVLYKTAKTNDFDNLYYLLNSIPLVIPEGKRIRSSKRQRSNKDTSGKNQGFDKSTSSDDAAEGKKAD